MSLSEMKGHLQARGYQSQGVSIQKIKDLTTTLFTLQSQVCGFGELSLFGGKVVEMIFKAADSDRDGNLNYTEINALQRNLGAIGVYNPKSYSSAIAESMFLSTKKQHFLKLQGLVAYY
jgi:hypothetical protein